jgi:catechol 2,3-dioxygenase-like lactoylglutathione lyase family enzyme
MPGPLDHAHAVTKIPVQDLDRARRWYSECLGLEAAEERAGGLRYLCGDTEFHLFASTGKASGISTQMGFEVEDLAATVADLRARGVSFERFDAPMFTQHDDGTIDVDGNYPSKGTGERGAFFYDCDGNLFGMGQATGPRDSSRAGAL